MPWTAPASWTWASLPRVAARCYIGAAALALAAAASAEPLNPLDFPSLGTVVLTPDETFGYAVIYDGINQPIILGLSSFDEYVGTVHDNEIVVFRFDNFTLQSGAVLDLSYTSRPVAFLASGSIVIAGQVLAPGGNGGPGGSVIGGTAGSGIAGGGHGGLGGAEELAFGATGGGYGGGPSNANCCNNPYGSLLRHLVGGSGGGGGRGGSSGAGGGGGGGGAGGGAVEFGALGSVDLTAAEIFIQGGNGGSGASGGTIQAQRGGGGSGGGLLVHAPSVALGVVNARGGDLGALPVGGAAGGGFGGRGGQLLDGGGGGGRIAIQSVNVPSTALINVAGGSVGGQPGLITIEHPELTAEDLDFGDVPINTSRSLALVIRNTGDTESSINGRFPEATGAFVRQGDGIFSALRHGRRVANSYTFTPDALGEYMQVVTIVSNAGDVPVTLRGRGVAPPCPGDADGDGDVDFADISAVLVNFNLLCR